jgi:hypothetical protein
MGTAGEAFSDDFERIRAAPIVWTTGAERALTQHCSHYIGGRSDLVQTSCVITSNDPIDCRRVRSAVIEDARTWSERPAPDCSSDAGRSDQVRTSCISPLSDCRPFSGLQLLYNDAGRTDLVRTSCIRLENVLQLFATTARSELSLPTIEFSKIFTNFIYLTQTHIDTLKKGAHYSMS